MEVNHPLCAFLRGINVNGRNMKMSDVCQVFRRAGMESVDSVLASGNILFRSEVPTTEMRGILEKAMSVHYSRELSLFVKNAGEVRCILESVPFPPDPELHIYAFICQQGFETVLLEEFSKIEPSPREAASIQNGIFYWQVTKGSTLEAGFSKVLGRKDMKDQFTSRNLNTIQKVYDKMKKMHS